MSKCFYFFGVQCVVLCLNHVTPLSPAPEIEFLISSLAFSVTCIVILECFMNIYFLNAFLRRVCNHASWETEIRKLVFITLEV